jgi:hypothetical protein
VLVLAGGSVFIPDKLTGGVNWVAHSDFASKVKGLAESKPAEEYTMIEMDVDSIRVSEENYQPVVILKEKDGERYLPIWIGSAEASAIGLILKGINTPRPLTHDLLCSIIDMLDANVDSVIVDDLQNDTFYAKIILSVDGRQVKVDSRPSDAIAIALRVKAPIYAEKAVLDKAGILPDHEAGKSIFKHKEEGKIGIKG